ncbi:YcxB family protein [Brucella intermedia]|uniref:YcxB family protein n=1 Tax=Brucella intermedia TaxID=94625 RepID=UPI00244EE2E6|nr:YcxB family protein [Brucella intermedia]WGJ08524.1 YcxB family protein [Brucella intermedia]
MHKRTAKITYTEEIVRGAVRAFVWQRGVARQKALWAAEAVLIAFLIWLLWRGQQGWLVGVVSVVVFLPPCLIITLWIAHYRNTVGKFRRMSSHQAEFTFLDEGLEIVSEVGSAKIPWLGVTEIWERPAFWMIFTAPNQFMTLPVQTISPADLDFLRTKVARAMSQKS